MITGFNQPDVARACALDYGDGAVVVDTLAQAYYPVAEEVTGGQLLHSGVAGWTAGKSNPERDLIEAVRKGHPAVVHAFLAKGSDPNARDSKGGTALHWTAAKGSAETVVLLLDAGALAGATDAGGKTALELAREKGRGKVVEALERAPGALYP